MKKYSLADLKVGEAPMGDPIDIELRDYELCLRKADLKQIEVEVVKN